MNTRNVQDYLELLRAGRWFHELPESLQGELTRRARLREVADGELLFARGDAPNGIFGTLSGAIRVSGSDEDGREALLTMLQTPSWFGEVALFDGLPRTHDARADGAALVVQVPQDSLTALLAAEPRYWRHFALLLTAKLRLAFVAMEDGALLPIAVRVTRRLVLIAEGYGEWHDRSSRVVEVSQEKLATMLGTSRQTANQVLKELEAKGLVRLTYGGVEILDLRGLKRA